MKDADSNVKDLYKEFFKGTDIYDLNFTIVNDSVYFQIKSKETLENILNRFGRNLTRIANKWLHLKEFVVDLTVKPERLRPVLDVFHNKLYMARSNQQFFN